MKLALVVAAARNGVIGRDNRLPWHLRADLQHFKKLTMGAPIIMGRRTWESIGRPLPGRQNLVVSRNTAWQADGAVACSDLQQAIQQAANSGAETAYVIGGAELYKHALPLADSLYLTEVDAEPDGDAWFHLPERAGWGRHLLAEQGADADNDHPFRVWHWQRTETS